MDLTQIKRLVIVAMFSDDELMEQLVLKGGNALDIVHNVVKRGSVDLDFSIAGDFVDLGDTKERLSRALRSTFDSAGLVVFDEQLVPKPKTVSADRADWWGGYLLTFKLIDKEKYRELGGDREQIRRQAHVVGPQLKKTFKVDISRYEYCDGKLETELDDFTIYVYTVEMIAIEKLRAICQQMPEYEPRGHRTSRARDFYDVWKIIVAGVDLTLPKNLQLFRLIFSAKHVPFSWLGRVSEFREFHSQGWAAVADTVVDDDLADFDFYFDNIVEVVSSLQALWEE